MSKRNHHIGSSLDDFLRQEGILEDARAVAIKETVAHQIQQVMAKDKSGNGSQDENQPGRAGPVS